MPVKPKVIRKLAAIMFTDIVSYTELTSTDEERAFNLIKKKRELLQPLIEKHSGKLIKEIGDGTLTRYFNTNDAINCANNFQSKTDDDLQVRAGIHTGEVIIDNEDVFGDVVNVASRLESIAKPKSVLVSKETIDKLENTEGLEFVSLGLQSLKGVGRLIEVFALKDDNLYTPHPDDYKENEVKAHSDDEVPSIAIIPFKNKGAEEDVFYAYGISADLITDCSSAGLIRVASLSDIEKLDYTNLDNVQLAEKLFVRYVSQGMLWKMGNMFQLSIELYDTKEQKVVWSDRWQEKWDNLPTIKGNLSDGLLKTLDTKPKEERKFETTNTEAYELYLKAKHTYEKRENTDDTNKARELLNKSIELDNNLIIAKIGLGWSYIGTGDYDEAYKIYIKALKQAEKIDDKRGMGSCLFCQGTVNGHKGDYDKALKCFGKSIAIFEELGDKFGIGGCLAGIGNVHYYKGNYDKALVYYNSSLAIKVELGDKFGTGGCLAGIGNVLKEKGDYDKALDYYNRSLVIFDEVGSESGIGLILNSIGLVQKEKGDNDKALHYHSLSLAIKENLGDKEGISLILNNIGNAYSNKGEYDNALDYYEKSLAIKEELDSKDGMGMSLHNIGNLFRRTGVNDKALHYLKRSLGIAEEIGSKKLMGLSLNNIGLVYYHKGEFNTVLDYFEKTLSIKREIKVPPISLLNTATTLYLTYKHLNKDYDEKEIHTLIKEAENIGYEINFSLYELLEDKFYIETAYAQIQEKADTMDDNLKGKFLNYPIPKRIVAEWKKVNAEVAS